MNLKKSVMPLCVLLFVSLFLSSCSGGGFHLRESVSLSGPYSKIAILGISPESELYKTLEKAIDDAGGDVVSPAQASARLVISKFKEDKKVVAYASGRVARGYLVYLRFDYLVKIASKQLETRSLNLDKPMIYDSNFVLGKAEEERLTLKALREEAARLILLHLKYGKQ